MECYNLMAGMLRATHFTTARSASGKKKKKDISLLVFGFGFAHFQITLFTQTYWLLRNAAEVNETHVCILRCAQTLRSINTPLHLKCNRPF